MPKVILSNISTWSQYHLSNINPIFLFAFASLED